MRPLEYGGREEIIDKQGHKAPRGLHERSQHLCPKTERCSFFTKMKMMQKRGKEIGSKTKIGTITCFEYSITSDVMKMQKYF